MAGSDGNGGIVSALAWDVWDGIEPLSIADPEPDPAPDPLANLFENQVLPGDWALQGGCRNPRLNSDDFFLEGRFRKGCDEYNAAKAKAKAVCALCPVREECLDYAIKADHRNGIWGGLTYNERRKLKYGVLKVAAS